MRREPLVTVGGLGLAALALWLVVAVLQELVGIVLRPFTPFVVWMMP